MRLFHLTSIDKAEKIISGRRLKVSEFRDANDPFEMMCFDLTDKKLREIQDYLKRGVENLTGFISFSESWYDPVLWGHYGDRHKGVAIGFDVADHVVNKIVYRKNKYVIDSRKFTTQYSYYSKIIDLFMRTKYKNWSYEKEWRVFVEKHDLCPETGYFFFDFCDDLVLKEVVLGPLVKVMPENLANLLSEFSSVEVTQARLAYGKYGVVKRRDWSWKSGGFRSAAE